MDSEKHVKFEVDKGSFSELNVCSRSQRKFYWIRLYQKLHALSIEKQRQVIYS